LRLFQKPVHQPRCALLRGIAGSVWIVGLAGLLLAGCKVDRADLSAALAHCGPVAENAALLPACDPAKSIGSTSSSAEPVATGTLPAKASPVATGKVMPPPRKGLVLPPQLQDPQTTASLGAHAPTAQPVSTASVAKPDPEQAAQKTATSKARAFSQNGRLADAVASAVMTFPEIKINEARVREAGYGIQISEAGLYPVLDLRLAGGGNFSGSYEGKSIPYNKATNSLDGRVDGGIILRQLVYDFGALEADIGRARFLRDAEKMKLQEKIEDVAHRTSQTYLKILEQRELLRLVDETVAAHEQLARIVSAHNQEGHGTVADVQRVNSRLVDVRAIRSDISLQLMAAEDQFGRLTRKPAGKLAPVPEYISALPKTPDAAIARVLAKNPRLGALHATRQSTQKELESQVASAFPKINLEVDGETKNYRNDKLGRTQPEGRAMMAMRYRVMDGGLSAATRNQLNARIEGADATYMSEREQLEADIRQAYRAIESAGRKLKLVSQGVESSRKVKELYLEQFKGGKRTIFELLDGQMSFYTIRRSQIESQFEGKRAAFDILRATGDLTVALSKRS
jgi:outer membrane protein, adhesin transport system